MKAKDYLKQLIFLDCKIKETSERVMTLKEAAENRTSNINPNKVQTSGSKQKMEGAVCSYVVLEERIKAYEDKRQEIHETINLLGPDEAAVIYLRYDRDLSLKQIAFKLNRSYSFVAKAHATGLKGIQDIINKNEKAGV